jgi:hypothetical protein
MHGQAAEIGAKIPPPVLSMIALHILFAPRPSIDLGPV